MSKRSAEDLLKVLRSWVGYGRSNGKQKIIIDIYNKDDPTHLPRDYINPAIQPLFDKMAEEVWKEVTSI